MLSVVSDTMCALPLRGTTESLDTSWMSPRSTRERRYISPFRLMRIKYLPPGSNSQNSNGVGAWDLKRGRGFVNVVSVAQCRSSLACSTTNARSSPVETAVRGET